MPPAHVVPTRKVQLVGIFCSPHVLFLASLVFWLRVKDPYSVYHAFVQRAPTDLLKTIFSLPWLCRSGSTSFPSVGVFVVRLATPLTGRWPKPWRLSGLCLLPIFRQFSVRSIGFAICYPWTGPSCQNSVHRGKPFVSGRNTLLSSVDYVIGQL
jgi:hypothetical protein